MITAIRRCARFIRGRKGKMNKYNRMPGEDGARDVAHQGPVTARSSLSRRGLLRIAGVGTAAFGLGLLPGRAEAADDAATAMDNNRPLKKPEATFPDGKSNVGALTLLIIRHAEKPDESWPGPGLTEDGREDKESLVIRGWERVGAWAALFGNGLGGADYPAPQHIYAAWPGLPDRLNKAPSRRPSETVTALASRLSVTPALNFRLGQEADLMAEVLALSGVVLVAWEHKAIIEAILPTIAVSQGTPPTYWPGDRFDVVLRFDRPNGQNKFAFRELYPRLLSGDSDLPLAK
jgi:hypothetical protein